MLIHYSFNIYDIHNQTVETGKSYPNSGSPEKFFFMKNISFNIYNLKKYGWKIFHIIEFLQQ